MPTTTKRPKSAAVKKAPAAPNAKRAGSKKKVAAAAEGSVTTTIEAPRPKYTFQIIQMQHESLWLEKKHLPYFVFPKEYSLDPCGNCAGHCCETTVFLTTVEAMRVALTLSLPFDDVVERLPADTTKGLSQTVPLALDEGPVRLTLKKRDPETMRCMFFFQVGSRGRCGIHAVRPGVCRQFPYTVNVDDETISAGPPLPCPVRWLYNEEVERRVEQDTRNWLRDIEDEKALAAAWEARDHEDKSWAAFTRFAIRRLAARFGKSADDLLAPPRRRKFSDPVVVVNDD